MKKLTGILMVSGLLVCVASPVQAAVMEGTWDTMNSDLMTGTWMETYGVDGPGRPGTELAAEAADGMQWMLAGVFILEPAMGHDNGDGTITYTTDYGNDADPGGSMLELGEAMTLWGDAIRFTNVMLTVEATIDMGTGDYVSGTFNGTAEGRAGWHIVIGGTLMRTGFLGDPQDPTGHEGTIDYMEVTLARRPLVVPMDIKPGSCPNPINSRSNGKFTVAILGTDAFDVTQIDTDSIMLVRRDGVGGRVAPLGSPQGMLPEYEDVGTPFRGDWCECHEMEGDGIEDLVLKFSTPEVADILELGDSRHGDVFQLVIKGILLSDGRPFVASDCVVTKGKAKGHTKRSRLGG